jgi:hypothetical protein
MTDLVLADRAAEWRRLKSLVLHSVSSRFTRRVFNRLYGMAFPATPRKRKLADPSEWPEK